LAELGNKPPPIDEESNGEIEQALREVHTTRFFLDSAKDPEWISWLDTHNHLNGLFSEDQITERDHTIANWLANTFTIHNPHEIWKILGKKGLQLNSNLWCSIAHIVGNSKEPPDDAILKRWVIILLATETETLEKHICIIGIDCHTVLRKRISRDCRQSFPCDE